jgi:hypothetical protein
VFILAGVNNRGGSFKVTQHYEIRVSGLLGPDWSDWFEGFSLRLEDGDVTVLSGPIVDQSALHGIIARLRDLNLPLLSVLQIGEKK